VTLGSAARMAAQQNSQVIEARARVDAAQARVMAQRSTLLPQVTAYAAQTAHTLNSASFGLELPTAPGQEPFLDPNGEIIGPVKLTDVRGRLSQTLFDMSALRRVRSARAASTAAEAQLQAAEQRAGATAASAYVQVFRAQQLFASRRADLVLAQDLLNIAKQ